MNDWLKLAQYVRDNRSEITKHKRDNLLSIFKGLGWKIPKGKNGKGMPTNVVLIDTIVANLEALERDGVLSDTNSQEEGSTAVTEPLKAVTEPVSDKPDEYGGSDWHRRRRIKSRA